ncbi:MAG: putative Ig domain-containing protein, partial [Bacilli bacterium]|nr:putative Ig domain-containing protein [Bacilli bacterium]
VGPNAAAIPGALSASYELAAGATLPAGLTLNSNGTITGTPTRAGTFRVAVVLHADGWVSKQFNVTLNIAESLTVTGTFKAGTALSDAKITQNVYAVGDQIGVSSWFGTSYYPIQSVALRSATGLPEGVTMDTEGNLTGTPATAGYYDVTVAVRATYNNNKNLDANFKTTIVVLKDDGTTPTPAGKSIVSVEELADGSGYKITFSDGTSINIYHGEKGEKGETGDKGAKGATGAQGAQGEKGETGATGAQGEKGETGATGAAGADGKDGKDGKDGTNATGGCGGSIAIASSITGALALGALALGIKRKKEQK